MRLLGAIVRAFWVVAIVMIPSLLLPDASQDSVELSLVVGAIIGVFTIFEYGAANPGFVDFRFAPPYNRFRVFTLAMQLITVTLTCRAIELRLLDFPVLEWANGITMRLDFEGSPVTHAIDTIFLKAEFSDQAALLLVYSASASFAVGVGLTVVFALLLWLFHWPQDRANFNLWLNLPMLTVRQGVDVVKRLRRDALFNIILSVLLIYGLPYLPTYGFDWLSTNTFESSQAIVWATTLWVFIPATLAMRALAMLKIASIIRRAQRG